MNFIGDSNEKLIVALDFSNLQEAQQCVHELGDLVQWYKVGMELFYVAGTDIIKFLKTENKKVFLDLKLQDIPNTVANALKVLTALGVDMINVHAVGGRTMLTEASNAVHSKADELGIKKPKLIAVTILTSMDKVEYEEINYKNSVSQQVVDLAKLAQSSGLDGVVASPQEARSIRTVCGKDFLIVTPGVRPLGSALNDQTRVATPLKAIQNGATQIVVGRPIIKAADRRVATLNILKEIENL